MRGAEEPTTVFAEVERDGLWELGAVVAADGGSRTIQGRAATLAERLALLPVVAWSDAERELVRGADGARRRFLDRAALLLDPATVAAETAFARVLRQKRHALARGGVTAPELAAWNELLAPHLVRRAVERRAIAAELEARTNARLAALDADLPPIAIAYRPSPAEAGEDVASVLAALESREAEERRRGLPLVGPQRDRVAIALGDGGTRRFASGGEQKIVGLALVAALAARLEALGRAPLVLLDDFESELDPGRAALATRLFEGLTQVLATSSREAPEGAPEGFRWRLAGGAITSMI